MAAGLKDENKFNSKLVNHTFKTDLVSHLARAKGLVNIQIYIFF